MYLFKRNNNNDSFFNTNFEDEFFNHPLISFPSVYPYYYHRPIENLEKQISQAFDKDVFKSVDFSPKINLGEDEKNYYIQADLPGLNKDQVKMELSDDNHFLTISGERETVIDNSNDEKEDLKEVKNENEKETEKTNNEENKKENKTKNRNNKKYSKMECSYGRFERSFSIPENTDVNAIQAKLENGVLEVILPKIAVPKPEPKRTIQIQ
jgi:HSP20 family protein